MQVKKSAKFAHAKNRSTEAIDLVDLPIAILDQEQFQLPQTVINSNKKHSLPSAGVSGIVSNDNDQFNQKQGTRSQNKKQARRFSQHKVSDTTPQAYIGVSPSQVINNDSMLGNPTEFINNDGKTSSMTKHGRIDTDED